MLVSVRLRVVSHTWTQVPRCATEQQGESTHPIQHSDQPTSCRSHIEANTQEITNEVR